MATTKKTPDISDALVRRVIALRAKGTTWDEILVKLDKPRSFIFKVRPLMKKIDRKSVAAIGRGSKNYGKGGR